ncbi:splicing regulator SDE2 [Sabethes cyaneus]|uniref:splicing regulator SDE2 n=1 Tax=Sabethes cyaneus TaxID=53552 RepID=UPI00237E5330|nr:splicing regulator SDE2 [Sabethes cyaneus]
MVQVVLGKQTYQVEEEELRAGNFHQWIKSKTGLLPSEYYLTQNGKRLQDGCYDKLLPSVPVRLHERLPGGKGGFGSMLRAIGAQIEKTTNREACRDLSGRRLRDINEEKRLKAYLEKQKDAPADEAAKLQQKIDKLLAKPKHEFHDEEYNRVRSDLTQNIDEAVQEGFRKALEAEKAAGFAAAVGAGGVKRKSDVTKGGGIKKKKAKGALWLGADDLGSSSSSSDSESDSAGSDSVGSSSGGGTSASVGSSEKGQLVQKTDAQEQERMVELAGNS